MDEYIKALARLDLVEKQKLKELLDLFSRGFHCIFTGKIPGFEVVEEITDDYKFIERMYVLGAKCIISFDRPLPQ